MAEVIDYWPESRRPAEKQFAYPWDQWMALDENGHGDIWLASLGVDWASTSNVANFRATIYTRTQSVNRRRKRDAPLKLMRVKGTNQVKRVPDFTQLRVKFTVVSDTQVAFQFYEGDEPPAVTQAPTRLAVPKRRPPLHAQIRSMQRVKVPR